MKIGIFGKLTGHVHLCYRIPAADSLLQLVPGMEKEEVEFHLDLKLVDRDGDGDPEVEVRWDVPGTKFDSGEEARTIEVPLSVLVGPVGEMVAFVLAKTGAPGLASAAIKAVVAP